MSSKNDHPKMSKDEKKRLIEHICVIYPRFQRLVEIIDQCREHSKISVEPEGILITGEPGSGKSTLSRWYLSLLPSYQTATETVCPVLHITVPVPATIKGLVTGLLAALGDPVPEKGTVVSQTRRLVNLIAKCQSEIILLDEFQHFLERESLVVLQAVSDWLKNLMNETRIAIVLIGTPKAEAVLDGQNNDQLRRRVPYRETINSFGWNTEAEKIEFRTFLQELDELLPFPESANLGDPKLAFCIFKATKGAVYNMMRLIRYAAVLALGDDLDKIDLECLRRAFEEKLAKNNPTVKNPFNLNN